LIEGADYFVRVVPFPICKVGGMVMPNDDGTYSVYLNDRVDYYRQRKAGEHELDHIVNGDFYNDRPITEVEDI
jgi:hypothetical protein